MDLLIVNSNTSADITELVRAEASASARTGTNITAITAPYGPPAIETPEDASIAAEATYEAITGHAGAVDAAVIACFSDPGLFATRSDVSFPVIGLAEAAMFTACMRGTRFSILTVAPSSVGGIKALAEEYGLHHRLGGVHALNRGVRESHENPTQTANELAALAKQAVISDKADVLVLGGAITAGMANAIAPLVDVPVLDGLRCAVQLAEMLSD